MFKVSGRNSAVDIQPTTEEQKTGRADDRCRMDNGGRNNEPAFTGLFPARNEPRYQKMLLQHGLLVRDILGYGQLFPTHAGDAVCVRQNFVRDSGPAQKSGNERGGKRSATS